MTTNKPEVVGFISEVGIKKLREDEYTGDWTLYAGPVRNSVTPLVRLSDYEALQTERDKLRKDVSGLLICDECHDKCADPYTGLFASHCPDEEPCIMCECSSLRRQLAEQQQPDMDQLGGFLAWLDAFVAVSEQAGIDDHEEAWTWPAPPTDPGFFDSYPQLTAGDLRAVHAALAAHRKQGGEV